MATVNICDICGEKAAKRYRIPWGTQFDGHRDDVWLQEIDVCTECDDKAERIADELSADAHAWKSANICKEQLKLIALRVLDLNAKQSANVVWRGPLQP